MYIDLTNSIVKLEVVGRYLLQVLFCTGQVAGMAASEHNGRATCQGFPTHGASVLPV